ncbi:hypothetical protein [Moorella sp. Hama-1]|uniref:hypothetical protein n=1 Tax=Moorella sp. Hama-1 TaxID=2138101 RepID=UPI000D6504F4|nr:hypothetical protein [Moorella sp. Hama-1]BCV22493.1 hypothetical protein hamaS1_25620 [Moorella sp. Hama-1]
MLILIVLGFLSIAYLDAPTLWQKKEWRELTVMGVIWALGLALALAVALNLPVPSPAQIMARAFGPLTEWLIGLIG